MTSKAIGPHVELNEALAKEFERLHGQLPEDEIEMRQRIHAMPIDDPQSALCLSGGGIRSATFCLGVVQGLARTGHLGSFRYLSTVSGGGYVGSWLTSWIRREGRISVVDQLKAGAGSSTNAPIEPLPVRRLRAYSSYLSPVRGVSTDLLTLIATFARNLVLHWSVFVPLLCAVLLLPRLYLSFLGLWPLHEEMPSQQTIMRACAILAAVCLVVAIAYISADLPGKPPEQPPGDRFTQFCFLPLVVAAILLSCVMLWLANSSLKWPWAPIKGQAQCPPWMLAAAAGAGLHLAGIGLGQGWRKLRKIPSRIDEQSSPLAGGVAAILSGAVGGALIFVATRLVMGWRKPSAAAALSNADILLYATVTVPLLLLVFWLGLTVFVGIARASTTEEDREWWARSSARWLGASVLWLGLFAIVIYGPQWLLSWNWIAQRPKEAVGGAAALLGILTSAIGYWSKNGATLQKKAQGIASALGMRLLDLMALAFTVLLFVCISVGFSLLWLSSGPVPAKASDNLGFAVQHIGALVHAPLRELFFLGGALFLFGWLMSRLTGVNTFSLHSMYGNRLVRAYLGASRKSRNPHWFTGFDPLDNMPLAEPAPEPGGRLFHVVNAALNLVQPAGDRLEWQQRKASTFTFSPLHCGSPRVGYLPTAQYAGGRDDQGLSLGRAMAISGAAASPNMGYHTSGIVAFVMAFFNVRLGWWLPNPRLSTIPPGSKWRLPEAIAHKLNSSEPARQALERIREMWQRRRSAAWISDEPRNDFSPLLAEALVGTSDDTASVYLSDGGHFDNLGLYEMVRRRCKRIVLVDATCDAKFSYADLENAIRKIRIDLGISIAFEKLPGATPAAMDAAHWCYGSVHYSDVDGPVSDGLIIYIKPLLSGDEPFDVQRYAQSTAKEAYPFPHQSTSDQFFTESQFESYRMLGLHSVLSGFPRGWTWPEAPQTSRSGVFHAPLATPSDAAGVGVVPGLPPSEDMGKVKEILSNASRAAESISDKVLLATAVTVGGALGVTGTVALKSGSEIALSKESMDLLKNGLQLHPPQAPNLDSDQKRSTDDAAALKTLVAELDKSLKELTEKVNRMPSLSPETAIATFSTATNALVTTTLRLTALADQLNSTKGTVTMTVQPSASLGVTLTALVTQLERLGAAIGTPGTRGAAGAAGAAGATSTPDDTSLRKAISDIDEKLKRIEGAVRETAPRRNIRPIDGSNR